MAMLGAFLAIILVVGVALLNLRYGPFLKSDKDQDSGLTPEEREREDYERWKDNQW